MLIAAAVTIVNNLDLAFAALEISAPGEDEWGEDRLGVATDASQSVQPGETQSCDLPEGSWDVRVLDADGHVLSVVSAASVKDGLLLAF